jgi:hypothetical protein
MKQLLSATHCPNAHAVQDTDDADPVSGLYLPASHAMQSADIVEPVALLNVPATHDVHELCPVELWYLWVGTQRKKKNSSRKLRYPEQTRTLKKSEGTAVESDLLSRRA